MAISFFNIMDNHTWTVAEAKARLSEILRLASSDGPQRIGTKKRYVVVPEAVWEKIITQPKPLGSWLLENMAPSDKLRAELGCESKDYEIELPDRSDPKRAIPFDEPEGQ